MRSTRAVAILPSHTVSLPSRSKAMSGAGARGCACRDERERDVEGGLERVDGDGLVGLVVALGAVGEVDDRQAGGDQGIGVAAAAGADVDGFDAGGPQRLGGDLDDRLAAPEAIAP